MLRVEYDQKQGLALLRWDQEDDEANWVPRLKRLAFDHSSDAALYDAHTLTLPWWSFASAREQFRQFLYVHGLRQGAGLHVSEAAARFLHQSRRAAESYREALHQPNLTRDKLETRLKEVGFARQLSEHQLRNVGRMAALPAAATFSVPGAGKTTEALAYYAHRSADGDRLLVVAPKNAFAAWDEQLTECLPHLQETFVRLRGGRDRILVSLAANPRFMLLTYQQLTRVQDLVASHLAQHRTFVFLDESHRIKAGVGGATARSVLNLSHLPAAKLIMSGTPMPQSSTDLVPQFQFLYPEIAAEPENVVDLIRAVYVRTNKRELGLPPVTRNLVMLPMAPVQLELYQLMRSEVAREAHVALNSRSRQAFRTLGRSVARLLQFVSNPSLLAAELEFAHGGLLSGVLAEGEGPKMAYVLRRARQLGRSGKKVLIWSSFVRNVEYISTRLSELGAVYIHGGVDAGSEDDDETREGKIKLFHDDPNIRVMVANPAAASEGVSLHRVCHHAIYLDRTFNAAHYLQSEDRIHRFGLPADQSTTVEIVECTASIDETVRRQLNFKIGQMAAALEDSSIVPDPIPIDPVELEGEDEDEYTTGLAIEDVRVLVQDLAGATS
ncbi:MAG: DEAD/DEAH box helicase [Mesorhizobium sp.]|nr:MAG: DEAD/DEAH box helicase [Mesorhizobium sp.]